MAGTQGAREQPLGRANHRPGQTPDCGWCPLGPNGSGNVDQDHRQDSERGQANGEPLVGAVTAEHDPTQLIAEPVRDDHEGVDGNEETEDE